MSARLERERQAYEAVTLWLCEARRLEIEFRAIGEPLPAPLVRVVDASPVQGDDGGTRG